LEVIPSHIFWQKNETQELTITENDDFLHTSNTHTWLCGQHASANS